MFGPKAHPVRKKATPVTSPRIRAKPAGGGVCGPLRERELEYTRCVRSPERFRCSVIMAAHFEKGSGFEKWFRPARLPLHRERREPPGRKTGQEDKVKDMSMKSYKQTKIEILRRLDRLGR
jgi:hypothetical protein